MAPVYDLTSGEWLVYRAGRLAAVELLGLRPGARVLDLGCGTGLSIPLLAAAVGAEGEVVGLDASPQMLVRAARRAGPLATPVRLVEGDLRAAESLLEPGGYDAALFAYSLSLVPRWREAWQAALSSTREGGRLCVLDMARPSGAARVLTPLARAACALGGSDIEAHPWTAVETLAEVASRSLRGGHLQVRSGTKPARA